MGEAPGGEREELGGVLSLLSCIPAAELVVTVSTPDDHIMANVAIARAYQQSFEARPYYTLAITNGVLSAVGDAVAQFTQRFVSLFPLAGLYVSQLLADRATG